MPPVVGVAIGLRETPEGRSGNRPARSNPLIAQSQGPRWTPGATETDRGLSACGLVGQGSTRGQQTPRHSGVIRLRCTGREHALLLGFLDWDVLSGTRRADLLIPRS